MGFEPRGILEFGVRRGAGDGEGAARRTDDDIAVHRGEGLFFPIDAECGDIDGIGVGSDTVNEILGWELICRSIGVFCAARTATDADGLGTDDLKQFGA